MLDTSENVERNLRVIFDKMSYCEGARENFQSIKKWLVEVRESLLTSVVNGISIIEDSSRALVYLDGLGEIIGENIRANLFIDDKTLLKAYATAYEKESVKSTPLDEGDRATRAKKFEALLKHHADELSYLEAYAGFVPTWLIRREDQPIWIQTVQSLVASEMRTQMEAGNRQILLRLGHSYHGLRDLVAALSAVIQVNGPTVIFVTCASVECGSARQLLPILFLIDAINGMKIRDVSIDVILMRDSVLNARTIPQLDQIDREQRRKGRGMIEIGYGVTRNPMSPLLSVETAALHVASANGKTIHYVIDSSTCLLPSVQSITSNAWCPGIRVNQRSRSLVFIHQPIYSTAVSQFEKTALKVKVNCWDTKTLTHCDAVRRRRVEPSPALDCVQALGAKLIAPLPMHSDFSVPTVVYDIGTSSALVALKEADLGPVLVLIPYRSIDELLSLGNNFGIPDQVFLYSSCFDTTLKIMKQLKGSQILVNSSCPRQHSNLELEIPWQVVNKNISPEKKKNLRSSDVKPGVKFTNWSELSSNVKTLKLKQLFCLSLLDDSIISLLLSYQLDMMRGCFLCVPIMSGIAGIIIGNPSDMPTLPLLVVLTACILRGSSVNVLTVGSDIPAELKRNVECSLPAGLVTFATVKSANDVQTIDSSWELMWIFQGSEDKIDLNFLPTNSENRILLVNNPADSFPEYNAKLAIKSAFKHCFM